MAGIYKEEWLPVIQENLLIKDLEVIRQVSMNLDDFVDNDQVNVPNMGDDAVVDENYSGTFPRTATPRVDNIKTFPINQYHTRPTFATYKDLHHLTYNKINTIVQNHMAVVRQRLGSVIVRNWAPDVANSGNAFYTTGSATASYNVGGQTGNRKKFTFADVQRLSTLLTLQEFDEDDRYLMLTPMMFESLCDDDRIRNSTALYGFTQNATVNIENKLPKLLGFNIIVRSNVLVYEAPALGDAAKKQFGLDGKYTLAATDNQAGLVFHKSAVATAYKDLDMNVGIPNDPAYNGGQQYQIATFLGASSLRTKVGQTGVIPVIMGA